MCCTLGHQDYEIVCVEPLRRGGAPLAALLS
jgi:hypothetical protein